MTHHAYPSENSASESSTQERGYRAVLVREETKQRLREFRATLSDRDINQERRLATAAIELILDEATITPEIKALWRKRVNEVVRRELSESDAAEINDVRADAVGTQDLRVA